MLAGTQNELTDAQGEKILTKLVAVSGTQITFLAPAMAALAPASLKVTNGSNVVDAGTVQINRVAPAVFAANGVTAAQIVRLKADGTQSYEPAVQLDAQGQVAPLPIDFGDPADQLFLLIYATGIRNNSGLVKLQIGDTDIPVTYAGPQGEVEGFDQVNTGALPQSLAGAGEQTVTLTVDQIPANKVKLAFK